MEGWWVDEWMDRWRYGQMMEEWISDGWWVDG